MRSPVVICHYLFITIMTSGLGCEDGDDEDEEEEAEDDDDDDG